LQLIILSAQINIYFSLFIFVYSASTAIVYAELGQIELLPAEMTWAFC